VPLNAVVVPSVAELPTCQKTLHACVPPVRSTVLPVAVVNVEPLWKMKTAFGSPPPLSVRVPVKSSELADWYVPGVKVNPPRVPAATVANGVSPAATR